MVVKEGTGKLPDPPAPSLVRADYREPMRRAQVRRSTRTGTAYPTRGRRVAQGKATSTRRPTVASCSSVVS